MTGSVAVIGAGAMGRPMAERLAKSGINTVICDRDVTTQTSMSARGFAVIDSAAGCATADLVVVLVSTAAQVRDVVLGEGGLHEGLVPGHRPVVAVMSTIGAAQLREIAEQTRDLSLDLIDCPISGMPLRAAAGTLAIMAAGDTHAIARVRPILDVLGQVFECGELGCAQTVKVLNNVIGSMNMLMTGETYRVGLAQGLSLDDMSRIFEAGSGRNWLTRDPDEAARLFALSASQGSNFTSLVSTVTKDFALARDLYDSTGGEFPVVTHALDVIGLVGEETAANWREVGASS